jgi:hypothetical protein
MYTTIEADIDNGVVRSTDATWLPAHAHVLITLLSSLSNDMKEVSVKAAVRAAPLRKPHAEIRGRVKVLGDIMNTAATEAWDLPV